MRSSVQYENSGEIFARRGPLALHGELYERTGCGHYLRFWLSMECIHIQKRKGKKMDQPFLGELYFLGRGTLYLQLQTFQIAANIVDLPNDANVESIDENIAEITAKQLRKPQTHESVIESLRGFQIIFVAGCDA